MKNTQTQQASPWIGSPKVDLFFFSFGWLVILFAYFWVDQGEFKNSGRILILNFVLLTSFLHRHLTFPLVYGDPEQFRLRKKAYSILPFIFLAATLVGLYYVKPATFLSDKVPTPIQISSNAEQNFLVSQGKQRERVVVAFTGIEKNLEEVAATLNEGLKGKVQVEVEGDRLRYTQTHASSDANFSFSVSKGQADLKQYLGINKSVINTFRATRPWLLALVILSALWNFYHTLMQKMGIVRVYSRKAGYGKPWLDKAMVFTWFSYLFFQLAAMESMRKEVLRLAEIGKLFNALLNPILPILPYLAGIALVIALAVTFLYLKEEFKNRANFHLPKNIFIFSILSLYAVFFYDFLVAYVIFGFSHAIEYLAFVNIFSKRKFIPKPASSSLVARFVHHQSLSMILFSFAMMMIAIPWFYFSRSTLDYYILGSSFMHFLYDGWIWKVRNPQVGQPLGIQYSPQSDLQVA